jgi:hypothetical protein
MPKKLGGFISAPASTFAFDDDASSTLSKRAAGGSLYSMSFSARWTFSTNGTFMPGLGSLSGQAIFAIGKAEISALRWVWVQYRRRVISSSLLGRSLNDHSCDIKGLGDMYDDLLDFMRSALAYSTMTRPLTFPVMTPTTPISDCGLWRRSFVECKQWAAWTWNCTTLSEELRPQPA